MRVLVTGSAAWTDADALRRELIKLPAGSTVAHGDSPGADALAGEIGLSVELVLAFHGGLDDPKRGKGTRHLIQIARSGCSLG
jgi:hypothetical protein